MLAQPQTFPCPNCGEIINDTLQKCRYCSAPVDPQAARDAGQLQAKVNQACSDASYLKTAAIVMWVFLGLSFIPLLPVVSWGFLFTFIVVLILIIRWHLKFSSVKTGDADFPRARGSKNLATILWVVAIPVGFVLRPLLFAIAFR